MAHIDRFNPQHATFIQHFSGTFPRIRCNGAQTTTRQTYGSNPLHLCHFSGINRANRLPIMTIQRFLGSFPPAISAEVMQKMQ